MDGLLKYFWYKVIATIPMCFLTFTQSSIDITWGIIYIIILDTILGMWVALKHKIFSSHHLSRVFNKIGTYGIALISIWVLASVEPMFAWTYRTMGLFIIITELFSNFEKLSLLGFKKPTKILSRVNKQFFNLLYSEGTEKEVITENILKNRNGSH